MIEADGPHVSRPIRCIVARLATSGEATLVRVRMARGAVFERNSYVFNVRLRISDGHVALVAGDCDMRARKREF